MSAHEGWFGTLTHVMERHRNVILRVLFYLYLLNGVIYSIYHSLLCEFHLRRHLLFILFNNFISADPQDMLSIGMLFNIFTNCCLLPLIDVFGTRFPLQKGVFSKDAD